MSKDCTAGFGQRAVDLALVNVEEVGKPSACLVVDQETGEVLHEANNQLSQSGEASAHAEITASKRGSTSRTAVAT